MMKYLKHLIKKYFQVIWLRSRFSPTVQISQRHLFNYYQLNCKNLRLVDAGFKVFSQFEEDGLILYVLSVIGMKNRTFVEIGSDDGLNSNCANLALNFGWYGLFIDGNSSSISRGKYFYKRYPNPFGRKPKFLEAKITRENINAVIESSGLSGEIDLLSIDIDGNDYWVWDALTIIRPRIVIIETHIIYHGKNIVVPYNPDYIFPGIDPQYHGASPVAMVNLGKKKGYKLVGSNALGFNFIFILEEEGKDVLNEISIEDALSHPLCITNDLNPHILDMPFVTPIE